MFGPWKGSGFPTHHPLDGALETYHWHGKRFGRCSLCCSESRGGWVLGFRLPCPCTPYPKKSFDRGLRSHSRGVTFNSYSSNTNYLRQNKQEISHNLPFVHAAQQFASVPGRILVPSRFPNALRIAATLPGANTPSNSESLSESPTVNP
ncbi:GXWXG domain-containing protein [Leptolyngbya sp. PCC 6406]|uniref:GXWXG domain-containing protein n=1 Tax=Leptolyngbya sp. PCC 6406 TaxID=1173264 RepID=UPI0009DE5585